MSHSHQTRCCNSLSIPSRRVQQVLLKLCQECVHVQRHVQNSPPALFLTELIKPHLPLLPEVFFPINDCFIVSQKLPWLCKMSLVVTCLWRDFGVFSLHLSEPHLLRGVMWRWNYRSICLFQSSQVRRTLLKKINGTKWGESFLTDFSVVSAHYNDSVYYRWYCFLFSVLMCRALLQL